MTKGKCEKGVTKRTCEKGATKRTCKKGVTKRTCEKGVTKRTCEKGAPKRTCEKGVTKRKRERRETKGKEKELQECIVRLHDVIKSQTEEIQRKNDVIVTLKKENSGLRKVNKEFRDQVRKFFGSHNNIQHRDVD